jgi:hypothetical protein
LGKNTEHLFAAEVGTSLSTSVAKFETVKKFFLLLGCYSALRYILHWFMLHMGRQHQKQWAVSNCRTCVCKSFSLRTGVDRSELYCTLIYVFHWLLRVHFVEKTALYSAWIYEPTYKCQFFLGRGFKIVMPCIRFWKMCSRASFFWDRISTVIEVPFERHFGTSKCEGPNIDPCPLPKCHFYLQCDLLVNEICLPSPF